MSAFTDPDVRAILCARGGYGTGRILEFLDFDTISRNAKIVAGYSDITVLHAAIASQCNFVTYHSPHPQDGWGCVDQLCQQTCDSFWSQLESPSIFDDRDGNAPRPLELVSGTALVEGTAEGRLLGGNLAVFVTLLGTRFMPDMRGAILFLEDIGERPYRVDRYLSQLRLSGVLKQLAGVILGHFADCTGDPHDDSLTLDEVFADYFGDLGIPVWQGYPSGHARPNLTLPLGATIRLDTNNTDQYTDGD